MLKATSVLLVSLLLLFTDLPSLRADTAQVDARAPVGEPGTRNGPALRVGTATGYTLFAGKETFALGGYVVAAARLGAITAEAELSHLGLYRREVEPNQPGSVPLGNVDRIGITGRLDIAEFGRGTVGKNTKLIFWIEAGLGAYRGRWLTGERFQGSDAVVGSGWLLDFRLRRPLGLPSRAGWHFGWRLVLPPSIQPGYMARIVCKGSSCSGQEDDNRLGVLVSSGMNVSW